MTLSPSETEILDAMLLRHPELSGCRERLIALHETLVRCYDGDGTLYVCGNGGSHADAMHIVGELCMRFERERPLSTEIAYRLASLPEGEVLAAHLGSGLRAYALGCNGSLRTAVENDIPVLGIGYAQELNVFAREGDVLLAISTSGNARNCRMALSVARARGTVAAVLTGPVGGAMASEGDLVIRAPGDSTSRIQESHAVLWHTMCRLIEAHYFPEPR